MLDSAFCNFPQAITFSIPHKNAHSLVAVRDQFFIKVQVLTFFQEDSLPFQRPFDYGLKAFPSKLLQANFWYHDLCKVQYHRAFSIEWCQHYKCQLFSYITFF